MVHCALRPGKRLLAPPEFWPALHRTYSRNGSKGQGTPITGINYSTSVSLTFGFNCTYKRLEQSMFRYSNIDSRPRQIICRDCQPADRACQHTRPKRPRKQHKRGGCRRQHRSPILLNFHTNARIRVFCTHRSRSLACLVCLRCPSS